MSYILKVVGIFIGVSITFEEFLQGFITYLGAEILTFIAILPIMFVAFMSKKGFWVSLCVTIVYALISFIGIWSPILSSVLPIISILRICDITALRIEYAFPMSINLTSLAIIGFISLTGIIYAAKIQEA